MRRLYQNAKEVLHLAIPLIATLLAQMGMVLVDVVMMGHLGVSELAAGSLAQAAYTMILVFCVGVSSAVGVLIARHYGAKEHVFVSDYLAQGLYVALILAIPVMIILWFTPNFYLAIGQDPHITQLAGDYLRPMLLGMPALLLYLVVREFIAALNFARIIMLIAFSIIPVGALLNYLLMYGFWFIPALGIQGIGIATAITQWAMLIILVWYILRTVDLYILLRRQSFIRINRQHISTIFKLGIPIGVMMVFEEGMFSVSSVLMGYFGEISLAAHQIALQGVTFFFMVPLGLAQATAILVSKALGAKEIQLAKRLVYTAIALGLMAALLFALTYLFLPHYLISVFLKEASKQPVVISLAVQFFIVAAVFQFLDAVQVISYGALRGYHDTFIPMLLGVLSYWLFGLLGGYLLAFQLGMGGVGLWWGLAIGIGISSVVLFARLKQRMVKASL